MNMEQPIDLDKTQPFTPVEEQSQEPKKITYHGMEVTIRSLDEDGTVHGVDQNGMEIVIPPEAAEEFKTEL